MDAPVIKEQGLESLCERAMGAGTAMDLSDCPYGETTGSCSFINRPATYYYFLAGLVRLERLTRVLEIGTNWGGAIMSVSKGMSESDRAAGRLVTVDIVRKNKEGFGRYPHIRRIQGDSLDRAVADEVTGCFDGEIDLLYIDSVHEYDHTKRNIELYAGRLNPRYVILDDIRQCDEMKRLWRELKAASGDNAFDASEISKRPGAGFGIIRWNR